MFQTLIEAEKAFKKEMIRNIPAPNGTEKLNPKATEPIISFVNPPVYGSLNSEFRDFAVPGLLILTVYLFSMTNTAMEVVNERITGTMDRTLVTGVRMFEIMLPLIVVQTAVLLIQTLSLILVTFYAFDVKNEGNLGLIIVLMIIQGLQAMALGINKDMKLRTDLMIISMNHKQDYWCLQLAMMS